MKRGRSCPALDKLALPAVLNQAQTLFQPDTGYFSAAMCGPAGHDIEPLLLSIGADPRTTAAAGA